MFSEGDEDKNRQKNEQCNIEPRSPAFPIETLVSLLFIPQFLEKLLFQIQPIFPPPEGSLLLFLTLLLETTVLK